MSEWSAWLWLVAVLKKMAVVMLQYGVRGKMVLQVPQVCIDALACIWQPIWILCVYV